MIQPLLDLLVIAAELRKSDEPITKDARKALAEEISRLVQLSSQELEKENN